MPVEVICDNCGETAEKKPCRVERSKYDFCSRECSDEFQSKQFAGESNPNYQGGGTYTCRNCGKTVETTPSKAEVGKYCNSDCMAEDFQDRFTGENNPSWNGGVETIICEWCRESAEFVPAEAEVRRFCCERCYKDWLSQELSGEQWVGEDNPAWKGGQVRDRHYGPNWRKQREKALERDGNECLQCGATEDLNVHHKKPVRTFDTDTDGWWRHANDLDNLVTLCRSCHMEVHQNPREFLGSLIG